MPSNKFRVYIIAQLLKISTREIMIVLNLMGFKVKTVQTPLKEEIISLIFGYYYLKFEESISNNSDFFLKYPNCIKLKDLEPSFNSALFKEVRSKLSQINLEVFYEKYSDNKYFEEIEKIINEANYLLNSDRME